MMAGPAAAQSKLDVEEIAEDLRIHFLLHRRKPLSPEFGGRNPLPCAELRMLRLHVDSGILPEKIAQKICLVLAVIPALFAAEKIPVSFLFSHNADVPRVQRNFLLEFANERDFGRLTLVHSTLGKLPGSGNVRAFADENFPFAVAEDACDIELKSRLGMTHETE